MVAAFHVFIALSLTRCDQDRDPEPVAPYPQCVLHVTTATATPRLTAGCLSRHHRMPARSTPLRNNTTAPPLQLETRTLASRSFKFHNPGEGPY